ncbi:MAG: hypothetical protein CME64_10540 [Halobacteriovoraceae bacterium]|nr:hypothetical protein [Halobacteriovoraceae bacterium]
MTKVNSQTYSLFYLQKQGRFVKFSVPISAFIIYKSFRINILTGEREYQGLKDFLERLKDVELFDEFKKPHVFHLFYEAGYIVENCEELAKENVPLAIEIVYGESAIVDPPKGNSLPSINPAQYPSFKQYKKQFKEGREKLLKGECYQFNLTSPFIFKFEAQTEVDEFIARVWKDKDKTAAFAHCTYISELNQLYLSNSPECLFQFKQSPSPAVYSMPIKGTIPVKESKDRSSDWRKLRACKKNEAELFMITDLVRNDLTRIQLSPSVICAKKLPLNVPGIVHQFSVVKSPAAEGLNLSQVVSGLFPGGSVTGAPKKNVLRILKSLENYDRGFYCGSTIVLHKGLKAASINIRSCEVDFGSSEMKYCAGGGITLNSEARSEFDETYAKMESFLQLLKE